MTISSRICPLTTTATGIAMRANAKDTMGFVLVVATFATLAIHNSSEHQIGHATFEALVLVDVNVLPGPGQDPDEHQVVLVQSGVVTRVGPMGVVDAPADAEVYQASGMYLLPGSLERLQELYEARSEPHAEGQPLQPGARADFVLLDADPRVDRDTMRRPRAALSDGRWIEERELARMLADPGRRVTDGGGF